MWLKKKYLKMVDKYQAMDISSSLMSFWEVFELFLSQQETVAVKLLVKHAFYY